MKRDRYKTVTSKESFAVLVPAAPEQEMGSATFLSHATPGIPLHVRLFNAIDLKSERRRLRGVEGKEFDALVTLRGALEANDDLAMARASELLELVYQMRARELERQQQPATDAGNRDFMEQIVASLRPGAEIRNNPALLFSLEVSRHVGLLNAQIVLWWWEKQFIPAIFCLDMTSALYLHTFFIAPTGELGFRVCPHCHHSFFQERTNQDYCVPAHRDAHRVARFRNVKKLEAERKSGRKDGTDETR